MTHTPGPWNVGEREKYHRQHYRAIVVEDPLLGTDEIAWVICDWDETEPDAALIASAPELLEACKAFVTAWEKCLQLEKTDVALRLAKAAIAKAEASQ